MNIPPVRSDHLLRHIRSPAVFWVSNGKRKGWVTILVWDCFARLSLVTLASFLSSLCHPTRPDDADGGGAFQDVPNSCRFRLLKRFEVCFRALYEIESEMRCRSLSSAAVVGQMSNLTSFDAKKMVKCEKRALGQVGANQWLYASLERLCNPIEDGTQEAAYWVRCLYSWLLECFGGLCPWFFPAHQVAASDGSKALAMTAGLALVSAVLVVSGGLLLASP